MKIPFSTFSTFVVGTPAVKLSSVASFKAGYDVKNDYWKRPREAIPKNHQSVNTKAGLDAFLNQASVTASSKAQNFKLRVDAYKKWWGGHAIVWVAGGKSRSWVVGGLEIGVSPELFITIDGAPHVVRLYFNTEKLPKDRANVMLRLMELTYHKGTVKPTVGVLDLGQGKLVTPKASLKYLDPLLAGEAASFSAVYDSLP